VFENRVLRRILGPKMVEATGEFTKLYRVFQKELYNFES